MSKTQQIVRFSVHVMRLNWKAPAEAESLRRNVDQQLTVIVKKSKHGNWLMISIDELERRASGHIGFRIQCEIEAAFKYNKMIKCLKNRLVIQDPIKLKSTSNFREFVEFFIQVLNDIEGCQADFLSYREEIPINGMTIEEQLREDLRRRTYRLSYPNPRNDTSKSWHQKVSGIGLTPKDAAKLLGVSIWETPTPNQWQAPILDIANWERLMKAGLQEHIKDLIDFDPLALATPKHLVLIEIVEE